ncbi:response regulator [Pseudoalteromonas sp. MMG010]|uniref:response regulator n=1 Tax=Pseudoalteromonas sp. MMG010 TaxID=2822685 RepID=UPI001B39DBB6|nr:response regulator [Pseudoalteromonas sp. MMG010]MBQ4834086.1 response regulator [Pseudoalteromonas sp. MMG010]
MPDKIKINYSKVYNFKRTFWLSFVIISMISIILDHINFTRAEEAHRLQIQSEVSIYKTRLESILLANMQLVRGLAAAVAAEPDLDQDRFAQISASLFKTSPEIRHLAGAPNMVISMIYPLKGNESVLGLNFLETEHLKSDVIKARDNNAIIMAGPVNLLQEGSSALIARIPVFLPTDNSFWGILSLVLSPQKVYQSAGIDTLEKNYHVAIQGRNGTGENGDFFYGSQGILDRNPLKFTSAFPGGTWKLYVAPKAGWSPKQSTIWPFRIALITIFGILIWSFQFFLRMLNRQQKNEKMLETMSNLAKVGAWSFNFKTKKAYWSDAIKEIFKYPLDTQPDWPVDLSYFKPGFSRNKVKTLIERAIKDDENFVAELEIMNAQGQPVWVLVHGETERINGRCVKLFGSLQNINTRKKIELENKKIALHNEVLASLTVNVQVLNGQLSQSKEVITQAICQALHAQRSSLWFYNDDKSHLECFASHSNNSTPLNNNVIWQQAFLPELFSRLANSAIFNAKNAQENSALAPLRALYLKPLGINDMLCVSIPAPSGSIGMVCVEQCGNTDNWSGNEESFLIAVAALISSLYSSQQRIETEQQLVKAKETAEQAVKAKGEFLASMSHEIRTPMNGVLGMLNIVQQSELDQQQNHHLELAQSSAQSLLNIINDILDFSKIEAGKLDIEEIQFNLSKLLGEVVESFALKAEQNKTTLILDATRIRVTDIISDPNRLRQILNNLVGNAVKFTLEGEIIITAQISTNSDGEFLHCSVIDSGLGIAPDKQKTLFDSFTQADTSTTRQFGGTGLGLAIVKQLCQLMQGEVSVTSAEGVGSTFSFSVKIQPRISPQEGFPSHLIKGKHILVVDNNTLNANIVYKQLTIWGANVQCITDYNEVIEYINNTQHFPDAVLIDYYFFETANPKYVNALQNMLYKRLSKIILMAPMSYAKSDAQPALKIDCIVFKPLTPSDLFDSLVNEKFIEKKHKEYHTAPIVKPALITPKSTVSEQGEIQPPSEAHLLLVEDNKVNQVVAAALLKQLKVTFDIAENGKHALEKLQQKEGKPYDLILMDCQMPVMDGYQTTNAIRNGEANKENKGITIIALTANAMQGDREKCLAAGMDDYLTKPLDIAALEPKLKQWLDKQ